MNNILKIKSLKINFVRGIKELELDLNGKSLLLYGENGTGKSSIVDALEFFFSGEITHISKIKSLSIKKHLPHIHASYENVQVSIDFIPSSVYITRKISKQMEIPNHLKKYFDELCYGRFILRRYQILEFIYSQPAERFEAISQIIGIDHINNIESILQKICDQIKIQIEAKENTMRYILDSFSTLFGIHIKNRYEIIEILNTILIEQGFPQLSSIDEVDNYLDVLLKNGTELSQNKTSKIFSSLQQILLQMEHITMEKDSDKITILKEKNDRSIVERKNINLDLIEFLKLGKQQVENLTTNTEYPSAQSLQQKQIICPLCQSYVDKEKVTNQVTEKLEKMSSISEKIEIIKKLVAYLSNSFDNISSLLETLSEDLKNKTEGLEDFTYESQSLCTLVKNIAELKTDINDLVAKSGKFNEEKFYTISNQLKNIKKQIEKKIDAILEKNEIPQKQKLINTFSIMKQVKTKYIEIIQVDDELSQLKQSYNISKIIYQTYSKVKKQKIQQIYDDIQQDIEKFYSFIHRGEKCNDIRLLIDVEKKGSTEIKISSFVKDSYVDPRAFQSEGHLDSLGLCIFLAFVKKFNTSIELIILDDVVTTIDSQHRMRICELIYENFKDKQIIITTHDNIWFEQLESYQNKYNIRNKFLNLKIDSWTVDEGPKLSIYSARDERIKNKIQNNEKNSVGNEIRQYFESVLKDICQNLYAEVPFRLDGKYMIDELFNSSKKRINKLIKDSPWKTEIFEIYMQIEGVRFLTNILSHDNLEILQISISEIEYLYDSIKKLENKFKCPECLKSLEYDRRGSLIRCVNPKCKNRLILETI